jgi:hypothetical protein
VTANHEKSMKTKTRRASTAFEPGKPPATRKWKPSKRSTADSLLRFAGTWVGDDLEECLKELYATRSRMEFGFLPEGNPAREEVGSPRRWTMKTTSLAEGAPPAQRRSTAGPARPESRRSTGRTLLACADKWEGEDFERCLKEVYAARAKARF